MDVDATPARAGCALVAVASALLLHGVVVLQPGWPASAAVALLVLLAALRPFNALLVLAGLGPLATILIHMLGDTTGALRFSEALTLAFLTGTAARRAVERRPFGLTASLGWPAAILIAAAVASGIVRAAVLAAEQPDLTMGGTVPWGLFRRYLILHDPFALAMQFAEGVALFVLVADLCAGNAGRRTSVLRMMIGGAGAAACFNLLRIVTAAIHQDAPWTALAQFATQLRVNVHFADWNAAGSYFGMMLAIAAAFAAGRRMLYVLPAVPIGIALWLTGSRTALAAVTLVAVAAGLLAALRNPPRRRTVAYAAVTSLLVIAMAGWCWYPANRNDPAAFSVATRFELSKAGIRMAADQPLSGVGIGRFYELSREYAGDVLNSFGRERENAHNNFIQILAELGVPGLLLFGALVGVALRRAWPAHDSPLDAWALPAGLTAFLLTCVTGHPLLTPQSAHAFWIAAGVAAASAPAARPFNRWLRWGAVAALLMYAVWLPIQAREALRHANRSNATIGMSGWHRTPDGSRFRWAGPRSTFFFEASSVAIGIPLRAGPDAPGPLTARVFLDGREADRAELPDGETWRRVRFPTGRRAQGDFSRIDIEVTRGGGGPIQDGAQVLAIGQPTLLWDLGDDSAPTRDVPLVGEIDGDGKADLVVWSVATGTWRWLTSSTAYDTRAARSRQWSDQKLGAIPLLGDLDGDRKSDLAVWRPANGSWFWRTSSSGYRESAVEAVEWPGADAAPGDVPLLGDIDGDGRADLVLWRARSRAWHWRTSSSGYQLEGSLAREWRIGSSASVPHLADFDGDGRSDVAIWSRQATGAVLEWASPSSGASGSIAWEDRLPADMPLVADVDRDRKADVLSWRGSSGLWAWLTSSSGYRGSAAGERQWGDQRLGDVPVTADLDGDGAADLLVWRASTRTWYWLLSSAGYDPAAAGLKPWTF